MPFFFVSCVLAATGLAADSPFALVASTGRVAQFARIDFTIDAPTGYADPFDPAVVDLRVELTAPGGARIMIPAFFAQEFERQRMGERGGQRDWCYPSGLPAWKARFAPAVPGRYRVVGVLRDAQGERRSAATEFECVPSGSKGFIRVSKKDPRFFEFDNGLPFFAIGQNLAFIGDQQYVTVGKAEEIFGKLSDNGANFLRIWTCADDWAIAIEARKSAWGRSWGGKGNFVADPDHPGRKCLRLTSSNAVQEVNPSHSVALRPNTKYVFAARVLAESNVTVRAEVHGHTAVAARAPANVGGRAEIEIRCEFTTGAGDRWLGPARFRRDGEGVAWLSEVSLKERVGGPELLWEADMNRPARGYFNPLDCFLLDELLAAAERRGIYLQLCMLTRDLYMSAIQDESATNYDRAIADAKKFFRHAIARWGCSTSVAAWEYWNEMNPGLPAGRFYSELGQFFEENDPYHHLRTTSTWGPSARDCRHPRLDVADVHFYLRPTDGSRLANEVDAVLERSRWLREQAPHKPAHLGEFGLADDRWRITDDMKSVPDIRDLHNGLWASALSGASGTALFWWWERIDQRNGYPHYAGVSRFIADIPWNTGEVQVVNGTCSDPNVRVVALKAGNRAWIWLFDPAASWAKAALAKQPVPERTGLTIGIAGVGGTPRASWSDPETSEPRGETTPAMENGLWRIPVPSFRGDIACRLR